MILKSPLSWRPAGLFLLLVPVFIFLTYLGLAIFQRTGGLTTVRPMGGVALGLALVLGRRSAAPVFLAAAAGSVVVRLAEGKYLVSGLVSAGLTIAAAMALYALGGRRLRLDFRNWRCLLALMALAAAISVLASLVNAVSLRALGYSISWMQHGQWALTCALSFCVFTPVTVLLGSIGKRTLQAHGPQLAAVMAGLGLALCIPCFLPLPMPTLFVAPLAMAPVVMLAGMEGAVMGLLLTEVMLTATIAWRPGLAELSQTHSPGWQLFVSQILVAAMTMVILPLAAAVSKTQMLRAELRSAAGEAQEAAARLHGIIDAVHDYAIYMLDPTGHVLTWNSGAARSKGFTAAEVIGTHYARFFPPDAREAHLPAQELAEAEATGEHHAEGWRLRKDGTSFWAEVHLTAIRDQGGKLRGFTKICRDATARRAHMEQLAQAKDMAEKATEAKSEFLANMSHEIRTPLTSVIGFADLIQDAPGLHGPVKVYAEQVRNAAQVLMTLVNDILDYSKLESGEMVLTPAPMRVGDLLAEVVELLSVQARAKTLALEICPSPALERIILADRDRLRQILLNLVGNAIKFTPAGFARISVSPAADDGSRLRFAVEDSGIGITQDQVGRLFQRFSRLEEDSRQPGTGLGLAICKMLTETMGGRIGVDSRPGQGSRFWFEIPAPSAAGLGIQAPGVAGDAALAPQTAILVVDDKSSNRLLVRAALEPDGIAVTEASSGEEALNLAQGRKFDLILPDMLMPGMDGETTLPALRARGHDQTPIVAFTAQSERQKQDELIASGFDAVCVKPFRIEDLKRVLAQVRAPHHRELENVA